MVGINIDDMIVGGIYQLNIKTIGFVDEVPSYGEDKMVLVRQGAKLVLVKKLKVKEHRVNNYEEWTGRFLEGSRLVTIVFLADNKGFVSKLDKIL